jgi:hypothetical protein
MRALHFSEMVGGANRFSVLAALSRAIFEFAPRIANRMPFGSLFSLPMRFHVTHES